MTKTGSLFFRTPANEVDIELVSIDLRSGRPVGADPMAGGGTIPIEAAGLAVGAAIRRPPDLPFRHLAAFDGLPMDAPDLFPGTVPRILALDIDQERIPQWCGTSARPA